MECAGGSVWCGIHYRRIIDMALDGEIPAIAIGDSRIERLPGSRTGKRRRRCTSVSDPASRVLRLVRKSPAKKAG